MSPERSGALQELVNKSLKQIQVETAFTWAYRAWAARQLAASARIDNDIHGAIGFLNDATEYEHEAVEHAALSGDDSVLGRVRSIVAG